MELFGVGIGEAGLVLLIALLVVGPERFPQVAREGGRWYRMARRFTAEVTADLRGALAELENEVNEQAGELRSVREISEEVRAGMRETSADLNSIGRDLGTAVTPSDAPPATGAPPPPEPAGDQAATTEQGLARVTSAYSEYHAPAAPEPVPATVDPEEMARHATESFEGFRRADVPASPSIITGVNPFPSSAPPALPAGATLPPAQVAQTSEPPSPQPPSETGDAGTALPAPATATALPPQRTQGAPATDA